MSRSGSVVRSYAKPEGYQIVELLSEEGALLVVHSFQHEGIIAGYQKNLRGYHISSMFADNAISASLGEDGYLQIEAMHAFDGAVFHYLRAE